MKESFHSLRAHAFASFRVLSIPSLAHNGGEDIAERHTFRPFEFLRSTKAMAIGEQRRSSGEDGRPLRGLDGWGYGSEVHKIVQWTRRDQLQAYVMRFRKSLGHEWHARPGGSSS